MLDNFRILQRHIEEEEKHGTERSSSLIRVDARAVSSHFDSDRGAKDVLTVIDERTQQRYTLPITEGNTIRAADLQQIRDSKHSVGLRTYDPGYVNTAACISRISYIDGDKGILRYRGYPIEQLAEKSNYLEVAYLLLYGELPAEQQLKVWERTVMRKSEVPVEVEQAIMALPRDAHPMAVVLTGIAALSTLYPEQNPALAGQSVYNSRRVQDEQITRLLGAMPAIAALAYHKSTGLKTSTPNQQLSYAENFLYMLDSRNNPNYKPHPRLARALDIMFILHAEHEMNCSTAAARHLSSSGVDVYIAMVGAIGALYGPLHGGANEAVLKMLERIGSVDRIPEFLARVKAREEIMFGFGHRVYKNFDPRAKIIKEVAEEVFQIAGRDPLIDVAIALQDAARSDDYFIKRKLYPNVDFYSGLVYRALGFPAQFFTVLFAIPRVAGYLAHWRESLTDPDVKIARPQQDYRGVWLRDFEPTAARHGGSDSLDATVAQPPNEHLRRTAGTNCQ